jgi:hypothetical protein
MSNRPQRNHNPVNLRFAGQIEATGQDSAGFAVFPDDPAGWRAAHLQIEADQKRNLTLRHFIFKFAPPGENNTNAYLEFIANSYGVPPDYMLVALSKYALAGIMAQFEGYFAKEVKSGT